ncbi:MAG: VWA domain-containing protein [Rhodanobacteraceae bacterium]|jgi:Ca-activated chloride channel family protein|nr:VWA domain-containing protein [Rhodanobacteraceae bacterium]
MLELAWPWLLVLLPLPWLAAWLLPRARGAIGSALRLPHPGFALPPQAERSPVPRLRRVGALLAWALLVLAAARPQWLGAPEDVPRSGRDLLLAIDTSGSMSIEDMQLGGHAVPRFAAIQAIAADFVHRRAGDRVGLILFGTRAYLLVPLTFDLKTVAKQLGESTIGLAGRETAIGDAVGLAVKRLRDRPQPQRVLVLLTDGVSNAGELDPDKAIELAAANHVRVYTIGVGADAMRVESLFGSRVVNPSADLDEAMLTRMAQATGGRYFRARNSAELAEIYRSIDQLEPVADTNESLRPVDELYWLPLAASLALGALAFVLPGRRLRAARALEAA